MRPQLGHISNTWEPFSRNTAHTQLLQTTKSLFSAPLFVLSDIRIKYKIIKAIFLIERHKINLLSIDGVAHYYGKILTFDQANRYFE